MEYSVDLNTRKLSVSFDNITIYKSCFIYGLVFDLEEFYGQKIDTNQLIITCNQILKHYNNIKSYDIVFNEGIIEIGFKSKEERDISLNIKVILNNQKIKPYKPYYSELPIAFSRFTNLPGDIVDDELEIALNNSMYFGSILHFKHLKHNEINSIYTNEAIAIVRIYENYKDKIDTIPIKIGLMKEKDKTQVKVNVEWVFRFDIDNDYSNNL